MRSSWRRKKSVIHSRNTFFSRFSSWMIGVLLIEIAERLRQLEGVLGDVRRLAGSDRVLQGRIGLGSGQQHLPEILGLKLAGHGDWASSSAAKSGTRSPRLLQLAQDVARAHGGVLHVGAGLALEAEGLLQVEGDHRIARELQQEIAQRADGDLRWPPCGSAPRRSSGWRDATSSSAFCDQGVHQVVGLHAEPLAAGDLHVRALAVFLGKRDAQVGAAARRSATIS